MQFSLKNFCLGLIGKKLHSNQVEIYNKALKPSSDSLENFSILEQFANIF